MGANLIKNWGLVSTYFSTLVSLLITKGLNNYLSSIYDFGKISNFQLLFREFLGSSNLLQIDVFKASLRSIHTPQNLLLHEACIRNRYHGGRSPALPLYFKDRYLIMFGCLDRIYKIYRMFCLIYLVNPVNPV